jgi:hypothetical protein
MEKGETKKMGEVHVPREPKMPKMRKVPDMPKMKKMPDMKKSSSDGEEFRLRAFPSDIHCGVRYPLEVAFPNSSDHPEEGKTIDCRLGHTCAVRVPRDGWCFVAVLTATVKNASWPLCADTGHSCGVSLGKPHYSSRRLSTDVSFANMPTQMTNKYSSRLFLQVAIYKDGTAIYASTPVPLYFSRKRHCSVQKAEVEQFHVEDRWVTISFFNSKPSLAIPYVKVDPHLFCAWVKNPVQDLVPHSYISFQYDPFTDEVVSPIKIVC